MNVLKVLIFLILLPSISHAYRECPADMVLWQAPGMLEPDCTCPFGKKLLRKLNNGSALYNSSLFLGRCSPAYSSTAATPYEADPASKSNLVLWLDADDPYNSGGGGGSAPAGALAKWRDKSVNNFSLTAGCVSGSGPFYVYPATKPTNRVPNYIDFYNNGQCSYQTNLSAVNLSSGVTVFAVVNLNAGVTAGYGGIVEHRAPAGTSGFALLHKTGVNGFWFEGYNGGNCHVDSTNSANTWYLVTGVWKSDGTVQLYINGASQGTCSTSAPPATITSATGIGTRTYDTTVFPGSIAEIIVYNNGGLTATQLANINNYLNTKWTIY